jgi:hypothetical protein
MIPFPVKITHSCYNNIYGVHGCSKVQVFKYVDAHINYIYKNPYQPVL